MAPRNTAGDPRPIFGPFSPPRQSATGRHSGWIRFVTLYKSIVARCESSPNPEEPRSRYACRSPRIRKGGAIDEIRESLGPYTKSINHDAGRTGVRLRG